MLSDAKAKLDQAVKDGKLTDAQRDEIVAGLESRIDDLVNRKGLDRVRTSTSACGSTTSSSDPDGTRQPG